MLSAGWDEDLIQRLGALAGGNVEFRTLPVVRYDDIDGQSVNIIDQAAIKAEVAAAIGGAASTTPTTATASKPNPATVVDVVNSGSLSGLAGEVSRALKKRGYTMGQVRDRNSGEPSAATIQYGAGADTDARNVASLLGIERSEPTGSQPGARTHPGDRGYQLLLAGPGRDHQRRDHNHHHDDHDNNQQVQSLRV